MKTNSLNKGISTLLLSLLVAGSLLQNNYQEQYKYASIDLLSVRTDTAVECLADPEQAHITIAKILSTFEEQATKPTQGDSGNLYKTNIQQYSMHVKIIVSTTSFKSLDLPQINPFISIRHKSQPTHSSQEDEPFPIYC